jgi:hypothetical protein
MVDRLLPETVRLQVIGRALMEPASILISELAAQVVREEMVVAIPASLGV